MNGRERQADIYLGRLFGRRPRVPVAADALEARARAVMSARAFAYIAGGAGAEATMRVNRAAFERWRIVPRVLRDVAERDLSIELFGARLPAPLLLAPIGVLEMAHPEADLAVARAARAHGVPMIFSSQASRPMEACAAALGETPRWYQLYWGASDALARSFLERAEACGASAVVLTLDTKFLGWRPRDLDLAYLPFLEGKGLAQYLTDPVFLATLNEPVLGPEPSGRPGPAAVMAMVAAARRMPGGWLANLASGRARAAIRRFLADFPRPALGWSDLARLREMTQLPLVLKGVLHADDARRAVDSGVDGLIVSNHGGRQVDGAVGALDVLPGVVKAVGGRMPVLFDSGIRTAADIFKAIALGARAVLVGRPYAYGLAVGGEAGVREVVSNLLAELDLTLALAGCRTIAEVTAACLDGPYRDEPAVNGAEGSRVP